jgi:SAM-dependent methyltransferase
MRRRKARLINPFTDPATVTGYEAWYETVGRRADRLEKGLLRRLLACFPEARTMLEVGCGTGHFTRWFCELGLRAAGLDVSPAMLAEAAHLHSPPCVLGNGLALPFATGAFDLSVLITTLEFVADPAQALVEALRVARCGLILGALNRHSMLGWRLKRSGQSLWQMAHFFTPSELTHLVRRAAVRKPARIIWRTSLWPLWPEPLPLPWGGFIGLAIQVPGTSGLRQDFLPPARSSTRCPSARYLNEQTVKLLGRASQPSFIDFTSSKANAILEEVRRCTGEFCFRLTAQPWPKRRCRMPSPKPSASGHS